MVDRDDEVQEPRHDQNQDSRDQGDKRGNVRGGDGHCILQGSDTGNRIEAGNLTAGAVPE